MLPLRVQSVRLAVPELNRPPPPSPAELPLTVQSVRVIGRAANCRSRRRRSVGREYCRCRRVSRVAADGAVDQVGRAVIVQAAAAEPAELPLTVQSVRSGWPCRH